MRLGWKFFVSYLIVLAVGLLVMSLSTAYVAPGTFSSHMENMSGMHLDEESHGMGMMGQQNSSTVMVASREDLKASFRQSVNSALFKAGIAAMIAAVVATWLVSLWLVRPLRQMVKASHHIAAGHYDQRLKVHQNDELGDLVTSFNRMAEVLSETETMRQQLIADVSHELKTPLASIKGYMEGLQDGVIPPTPETFQLIHREADRLQRLVYDLQELSRAEAKAFQLDLCPHDPSEALQTVIARLQPQYTDKNVTLTCTCPDGLPAIRADEDRLEQVLTNLLGNALQYTPTGGNVSVAVKQAEGVMQFSIHDTGIGLSADELPHIFQRFYRVDKSRSRSSGGSGIGLTIAYHIVESHGGRLWAESSGPNQGSTFYFTLPLA
jgi:signal transduction histidine kinase